MGMIQNYCCVKVLGVSQIIRENPEIINKTDSQSRNIMHDLRQLGKKKFKWALRGSLPKSMHYVIMTRSAKCMTDGVIMC